LYDAYYEELERFAEKEGTLNLGLKTGMLSVADDLMKNEGKKFLEMMEKVPFVLPIESSLPLLTLISLAGRAANEEAVGGRG